MRLIIEIEGGVLQMVYGDKPAPNMKAEEIEIILRDLDNIKEGDPDPLDEIKSETDWQTYY